VESPFVKPTAYCYRSILQNTTDILRGRAKWAMAYPLKGLETLKDRFRVGSHRVMTPNRVKTWIATD